MAVLHRTAEIINSNFPDSTGIRANAWIRTDLHLAFLAAFTSKSGFRMTFAYAARLTI
jgi:hypothetical protein